MNDEQKENWEQGQEKLRTILLYLRYEPVDRHTRNAVKNLWSSGPTHGCKVQCDEVNNTPTVVTSGNLLATITMKLPDGSHMTRTMSMRDVVQEEDSKAKADG